MNEIRSDLADFIVSEESEEVDEVMLPLAAARIGTPAPAVIVIDSSEEDEVPRIGTPASAPIVIDSSEEDEVPLYTRLKQRQQLAMQATAPPNG